MILVEKLCVFDIILKQNNSSFCCFLNHIIYFCKSRVIHRRNRHESFNNKTINLWGQWWKKLLKHLSIWYVLLSSTRTNTQTRSQTNKQTHTQTHTHTLKCCTYVTHSSWLVCVGVIAVITSANLRISVNFSILSFWQNIDVHTQLYQISKY